VPTRTLGEAGPEVTVVGLGCNNFGRRVDLPGTRAVVDAALDAGITLFDTADIYGDGESESFLGEVLSDGRRDRVVLATKFGHTGSPMPGAPDVPRGSREYVRWAVDGSLRRLRTDRIDVYQHHTPDESTPVEETLAALNELVEEGKVLHIGSSNYSPQQIEEAERIAHERGLARYVSAQNRYSLIRQEPSGLLETCERLGIGMLPYFPLESGLLTGKYHRGEPSPAGTRLDGREDVLSDEAFDAVERVERYAEEHGVSLLQVAIGGLLALPAITSVIAGATKPEQVGANAAAGEWQPAAGDGDLRALAALRSG
jgi:aryl-alcohol dehydrogenase-like predicted oxidoreductase